MSDPRVSSVTLVTAHTGRSAKVNEFGMRPMQEEAYAHRGAQYLLIKSPPASGKSRALMFIALDKLHEQGVSQAIIVVPERSIGGSFADAPLTRYGFAWDWTVRPQWNLCNIPGADDPRVAKTKVKAVAEFLASEDRVLVCTHATFRFAVEELGIEAFDRRLIAVDEFHHVSANPDNRLGSQLNALIARDKVHLVAMTGSYFRGDAVAVLSPDDEAKFETVKYTYYQQLNGYEHLKTLDIGYSFYTGRYIDKINELLDPAVKTIVHIPSVNSRESTKDKHREVEEIMDHLGTWTGVEDATGFHLIKAADGKIIKVADLVEDEGAKRDRVVSALKSEGAKARDFVDVIIALGMAKEGFDWIWCEHALTVGYRASLTEIIQIIGRATRDAPGKTVARFTNLIAEPDASSESVTDAVNDYLKAIAASLLMEQVLAPRFDFTPKDVGERPGFDYGENGYVEGGRNVGWNEERSEFHFEIAGLAEPKTEEAARICREDLTEIVASFVQDKPTMERGLFDPETIPEEITQLRLGKIIRDRYPDLSDEDQEAVRQRAIAVLVVDQAGRANALAEVTDNPDIKANTALIDGVRKFAMDVRELDIDMIDHVNPFEASIAILAKALNEDRLKQVQAAINAKKITLTYDEARMLAKRALDFKKERGRLPELSSQDPWEQKMAAGIAFLQRHAAAANG